MTLLLLEKVILAGIYPARHEIFNVLKPNALYRLIVGKETSGAVVDIEAEVKDVD